MQRFASIVIAAGLLSAAGFANAAGQLAQVTVNQGVLSAADCAPPNYTRACARFHAAIRNNFTAREIGMLFGGSTAYLEYPSSYERLRARYAAFASNADQSSVAVAAR